MSLTDRTVHGLTTDGRSIVRYDRGGKWWIEPPRGSLAGARRVTVGQAAEEAASGTHFPGRCGGTRLDAIVRRILEDAAITRDSHDREGTIP